ncbi:hypothetical protein [Streptomyces sp. NPDC046821]|uniref:hypothetical protein n=1 Tax=Streptomyces sp. NPDC046821 TaxID=3154702 RepID=UPI0033D52A2F
MRGRGTGCAAVLVMLLAGCGNGGDGAPGEGAGKRPSAATGADGSVPGADGSVPDVAASAPGVDGSADPAKLFTDAELGSALLPPEAIGKHAKANEISLGLFDRHFGGGDWGACAAGRDARGELIRMTGASAERTVRPDPAATGDGNPYVFERLVSMPAARAGRYLELRRALHESCARVTVDTEAAPVVEHHEARPLPELGDEAFLETTRTTGDDEHDGTPHYEVELRVGGVLVTVGAGTDRALTLSSAAAAAQRVRKDLYGGS